MIILGNFLSAIAQVLDVVLNLFMILFIARAVLSWVSPDPSNVIVHFINSATEPILRRIRSKIPPFGMMDFSVLVAILIIFFLQNFLVQSMLDYAGKIKPSTYFSAPGF